jgi:VanZ family protein
MRILAVIAYVGVIFTLSSWSNPPTGPRVPHLDKFAHAIEYGILAILIGWAATPRRRWGWRRAGLAVTLGLVVAVADEIYQGLTPGRESSIYDVVADLVGLGLGAVVYERGGPGMSTSDLEGA